MKCNTRFGWIERAQDMYPNSQLAYDLEDAINDMCQEEYGCLNPFGTEEISADELLDYLFKWYGGVATASRAKMLIRYTHNIKI